jgi:hypothetical protein
VGQQPKPEHVPVNPQMKIALYVLVAIVGYKMFAPKIGLPAI